MSTSRAYHHGDLRSAILRAAGKLLEKQGIAGISLREAARRAGVSHNAPYRHFPDRETLLAALAAEGFERLGGALQAAGRVGGKEMGEAYVRFALAHPNRFRLMFGGQIRYARHPELLEAASRAHDALSGFFASLGGEREARTAAAAAWSLVHGLAHLLLDGHLAQAAHADPGTFVREVIGAIRFAVGAQRSA